MSFLLSMCECIGLLMRHLENRTGLRQPFETTSLVKMSNRFVLEDEEWDDEVDMEDGLVEELVFAGNAFGEFMCAFWLFVWVWVGAGDRDSSLGWVGVWIWDLTSDML